MLMQPKTAMRAIIHALEPAKEMPHSERSLFQHLRGTWRLLNDWGMPNDLCLAGLFHSVYGTAEYRNVLFTAAERQTVRRLIGVHAESLAYIFSIGDREAIWDNLEALAELPKRLDVRVFGTDGLMRVSGDVVGRLLVIECANFADQTCAVDGLPAPWMSWLLHWRQHLEPSAFRPPWASLVEDLTLEADQTACRLYREAVSSEPSMRRGLLEECVRTNQYAAEPRILLAADAIDCGRYGDAAIAIRLAMNILRVWSTTWDKRMTFREWSRQAERLASLSGRFQNDGCLDTFIEVLRKPPTRRRSLYE